MSIAQLNGTPKQLKTTIREDGSRRVQSMNYDFDEKGEILYDDNDCPRERASKTEQHHKSLCDINNIIKQYDKTGLITHVNKAIAQYGDFTEVNEYQESLNLVMEAQEAFNALPAAIRARFENDPGQFLEFATNPANADEMVELGLAKKIAEVVEETPPAPEEETPPAE